MSAHETTPDDRNTSVDEESTSEKVTAERHTRLQRTLGACARSAVYSTAFLTTAALSTLHADIHFTKEALTDSEPSLQSIAEAKSIAHNGEATVFIDGFGSEDGAWAVGFVAEAIQSLNDSNILALKYSKDGISAPAIAEKIAEHVQEHNLSSVSLYGYSIGGIVSLQTAIELMKEYHIPVSSIFLDHTPAGEDGIREKVRGFGTPIARTLNIANKLNLDLAHSTLVRKAIDISLSDIMGSINAPSTSLMKDQYLIGVSSPIDQYVASLSEQDLPPPKIWYISSNGDPVVDTEYSDTTYRDLSTEYGITYESIEVLSAVHGRLDLSIESYTTAFSATARSHGR